MNDQIQRLLERQARWQEARADLSWEEKVRMLERVREEFAKWCATTSDQPAAAASMRPGSSTRPS